jgi:hypothetical protein
MEEFNEIANGGGQVVIRRAWISKACAATS